MSAVAGDPSYAGLLNWSWTYDSAVSAAAFAATGDKANSAQLLDQLAALQHTDGLDRARLQRRQR
jgi:hypothetical protein